MVGDSVVDAVVALLVDGVVSALGAEEGVAVDSWSEGMATVT